jgi:hypothetical protein
MRIRIVSVMISALVAAGIAPTMAVAVTAASTATKCVINGQDGGRCPKPGSYYTAPRKIELAKGPGYTTTIVYDTVTDYSPQPPATVPTAFQVVMRVTAREKITISCKAGGHQLVPSDTHMNLYFNGTPLGYVPAYKSTCGDDPRTSIVLKPGQSTSWYAEFHYTPHPRDTISISQLSYATAIFHPFGSRALLPYPSSGPGSLSKSQATSDISYAKSFVAGAIHTIGDDVDSLGLNTEQWQDLGQLILQIPSCLIDLHDGQVSQDCYDTFTNFLDFAAPPVS